MESSWEIPKSYPKKISSKLPFEKFANNSKDIEEALFKLTGKSITAVLIPNNGSGTEKWHIDDQPTIDRNGVLNHSGKTYYSITFSHEDAGTDYLMLPLFRQHPTFDETKQEKIRDLILTHIIPTILNDPKHAKWIDAHTQKSEIGYFYEGLVNLYFHRTPTNPAERFHYAL